MELHSEKFFNNTNACKKIIYKFLSHQYKFMPITWLLFRKIFKMKKSLKKLKKILQRPKHTLRKWKSHYNESITYRWIWSICIDPCWWKRKSRSVRKHFKVTSICCSIYHYSLTTLSWMAKYAKMNLLQVRKSSVS